MKPSLSKAYGKIKMIKMKTELENMSIEIILYEQWREIFKNEEPQRPMRQI